MLCKPQAQFLHGHGFPLKFLCLFLQFLPYLSQPQLRKPWQWSFYTFEITCGAGEYRLRIQQPTSAEGILVTRWSWGHLDTALADSTAAGLVVSSSSSELDTGRVTTLAVQVDPQVLGDLRSLFVGLQWQGRNGKSAAQLSWVAAGWQEREPVVAQTQLSPKRVEIQSSLCFGFAWLSWVSQLSWQQLSF